MLAPNLAIVVRAGLRSNIVCTSEPGRGEKKSLLLTVCVCRSVGLLGAMDVTSGVAAAHAAAPSNSVGGLYVDVDNHPTTAPAPLEFQTILNEAQLTAVASAAAAVLPKGQELHEFQRAAVAYSVSGSDVCLVAQMGSGKSNCIIIPPLAEVLALGVFGFHVCIVPLVFLARMMSGGWQERLQAASSVFDVQLLVDDSQAKSLVKAWNAATRGNRPQERSTLAVMSPELWGILRTELTVASLKRILSFTIDEAHLILPFHDSIRNFSSLQKVGAFLENARFLLVSGTFVADSRRKLADFLLRPLPDFKLIYNIFIPRHVALYVIPANCEYQYGERILSLQPTRILIFLSNLSAEPEVLRWIRVIDRDVSAQQLRIYNAAGMSASERESAERWFLADDKERRYLIGTKGASTGQNNVNLTVVIVWGVPYEMADLCQAALRAGRKGQDSECFIVLRKGDVIRAPPLAVQMLGLVLPAPRSTKKKSGSDEAGSAARHEASFDSSTAMNTVDVLVQPDSVVPAKPLVRRCGTCRRDHEFPVPLPAEHLQFGNKSKPFHCNDVDNVCRSGVIRVCLWYSVASFQRDADALQMFQLRQFGEQCGKCSFCAPLDPPPPILLGQYVLVTKTEGPQSLQYGVVEHLTPKTADVHFGGGRLVRLKQTALLGFKERPGHVPVIGPGPTHPDVQIDADGLR